MVPAAIAMLQLPGYGRYRHVQSITALLRHYQDRGQCLYSESGQNLPKCPHSGAYELPEAARSVQLRIIAQNGIYIYSST